MEGTIQYGDRKIYCVGDPALLEFPSVAVAGTRKPGEKSRIAADRITREICELSGYPYGCGTIAAKAAVDARKPVIAVLPSGTSNIYPLINTLLAEKIVETGGCLISEYQPEERVELRNFKARDRLMAEIATAVIAVQCGEESRTMRMAKAACSLGRRLGCWMPAEPFDGDFSGNILMIRKYGASEIRTTDELKSFLERIE